MYHVISSNVRLKKQKVAAMATTKNSDEGFGPNGSMIIVDALTNNIAVQQLTYVPLTAKRLTWVHQGSVTYLFDHSNLRYRKQRCDELLEQLMEAKTLTFVTLFRRRPSDCLRWTKRLHTVRKAARRFRNHWNSQWAEIEMIPQSVTLEGDDRLFERMINALEDNERRLRVYHNVNLED